MKKLTHFLIVVSLFLFASDTMKSANTDESKPVIISIEKELTYHTDDSFSVYFIINHSGAKYVSVDVEEEYNSAVSNFMSFEPYTAHIRTGKISTFFNSWITVKASNDYGYTSETFHFEPSFVFGEDSIINEQLKLNDIQYDYKVFTDENGLLDCVGNLSFIIPVPNPNEIDHINFAKTKQHYPENTDIRFNSTSSIEIDPSLTAIVFKPENIHWDSYFQVHYYKKDSTWEHSPIYNTNSYITPADLEKLNGSASVNEITSVDYGFTYNSDTHSIDVRENCHIEIYDIVGRTLYKGIGTQSISLAQHIGKCVIIRCASQNGVHTQKLIL